MNEITAEPTPPLTDGWMCRAVRYANSEKPFAMALCHCDRCRPQSGSAFSTIIFVHRAAVSITGDVVDYRDVGSSGLKVLRGYCPRCGSPLTTIPDSTPGIIFIKAGGIDHNEWLHPGMELFAGKCRPW